MTPNYFLTSKHILIAILLFAQYHNSEGECNGNAPLSLTCEKGEFCGFVDEVCQPFSCANFYKNGHPAVTGRSATDPPELICDDEQNYIPPISTTYGCYGLQPIVSVGFHVKCVPKMPPASRHKFTCYEVGNNMDYTNFFIAIKPVITGPPDCENLTHSHYSYNYILANTTGGPRMEEEIRGAFTSDFFNLTLARSAVYVEYAAPSSVGYLQTYSFKLFSVFMLTVGAFIY